MKNADHDHVVNKAIEIAKKMAEVEQTYNRQMEELIEQMDAINLDKSEKYEIQERAIMEL